MEQRIRERFRSLASSCLQALAQIEKKFAWPERAASEILLRSEPNLGFIRTAQIPVHLRKTVEFQSLLDFATETPSLRQSLIEESHWDLDQPANRQMLRIYVEQLLTRAICFIGVEEKQEQNRMLDNFLGFLAVDSVSREVRVPLVHLKLEKERYHVGDFGILQQIDESSEQEIPKEILKAILSRPQCTLTFTIQTKRFLEARDCPLGEMLMARIGFLRVAVHPLISYNRFSVEHIRPWEAPLHDYDFHTRFWAQPASEGKVSAHMFTESHMNSIRETYTRFHEMRGESGTPWNLAVNRLEDAVFKLESGSPDAILDLVIGLESLFVEPESVQESTHKVAMRLARFLEENELSRRKVFREAKELYKLRSRLAHGHGWRLDEEGVSKVESGARLLTRALYKMVQRRTARLDHLALDLT